MIPTIYPTIYLQVVFDNATVYGFIKFHKLKGTYYKQGLISLLTAKELATESLEYNDVVAKYYPELLI